jgi:Tol biopolymer transport system component/imidazolonepropionase-like amidohydrolase
MLRQLTYTLSLTLLVVMSAFTAFSPQALLAQERRLITVDLVEGTNMSAAVSPDGSELILALQGVLWRIPAEGGQATQLTPPEMDAQEPIWAPQGNLVAFYAFAENGFTLWTIAPDGSGLRQWTGPEGDARYPAFTPDGSAILFSSDRQEGYSIMVVDRETGVQSQLIDSQDTGYQRPLTPYFSGAGNAVYPVISPDGSRLAFVIDGEQDALVVQNLADGDARQTLLNADTLGAPAWSADGSQLYVVALDSGSSYLAAVTAESGGVQRLVDGGDIFPFRPSLDEQGNLYYTGNGHLYQLDPATGDQSQVPFVASVELDRTPYQRRSYNFTDTASRVALGIIDPVLSPDAGHLAYAALGDLWLVDLDSGELEQLTDDVSVDLSPTWSPDGSHLVWVSDRGGKADLWSMAIDSGDVERLTDSDVPVNSPVYSPDGEEIAYLADSQTSIFIAATINVLDLEDSSIRTVSEPIFGPSAPAWSPDASRLAVYHRLPRNNRFREGHNAIYLVDSAGQGDSIWVVPEPGRSLGRRQFNRPAWSTTGEFVYRLDGALWQASLSPSGDLGPALMIAEAGENPSWSANGEALVYLDGEDLLVHDVAAGQARSVGAKPQWTPRVSETGVVIRVGRVFDGVAEDYLQDQDVVVSGGRIVSVSAADPDRQAGSFIDASDLTMLPGLIEGHAHQSTSQGAELGELFFRHGITSVRETGVDPYFAVERREAAASGRRPGPRVFTAGPLNEGARVSYGVSETIGTEAMAEQAARLSSELGLNLLKSYVRQDYSVQERIIELAHASGIPVTSHELFPSVAYGVDQMEHFGATSRRGYSLKSSRLNHSYQDVIELIVESGVVVTPTMAMGERPGRDMSPQMSTLRRIVEGGGRIQAGTDSPFIPHAEALHRELELYVESGLTPVKALRTATSESAEALGAADQIGQVAVGMMADLLLVDGDPLANISAIRQVEMVFQGGELMWSAP